MTPVRDAVVGRGIVINGLPIMIEAARGFGSLGGTISTSTTRTA